MNSTDSLKSEVSGQTILDTLLCRASLLGSGLFYRTSIAALIMTSLIVE